MKTQTLFRPCNFEQLLLLPPDMTHWLPQDHLAYFVRDVVGQMNLSVVYASYDGSQKEYPAYHEKLSRDTHGHPKNFGDVHKKQNRAAGILAVQGFLNGESRNQFVLLIAGPKPGFISGANAR
jgi:hypothetical protein